ncbi:hypothetical protein CYMTET_32505 [Cymbomonas tetramitiformis]|uniref:Uncharacterized protein n=1 Tax=Cymbomonas tetramitiformis TaxID=36881 RepID=A0AAE0FFB5_9CHLO|nr:hypothetical protein CYMTET_32505 [Cymbomonas tetramitiformis]
MTVRSGVIVIRSSRSPSRSRYRCAALQSLQSFPFNSVVQIKKVEYIDLLVSRTFARGYTDRSVTPAAPILECLGCVPFSRSFGTSGFKRNSRPLAPKPLNLGAISKSNAHKADVEEDAQGAFRDSDGTLLGAQGPDALYHQIVEFGMNWSDRLAEAEYLEERKKVVVAQLIVRLMANGSTSRALAETQALASDDYQEHIQRMTEARRIANRARVQYDALKQKAQLVRTYEATRRAEMQIL